MIRLNMMVEGQTEESFVNRVLKPHLLKLDIVPTPRLVFTGRKFGRTYRGGVTRYGNFKWDLLLWMREDSSENTRFTTMLDLYGLPGDFPGQAQVRRINNPMKRVHILEHAMSDDIADWRLIPYIQLHEFEALLLSDAEQFGRFFIEYKDRANQLASMVRNYSSPEYINGGEDTAPSKRIMYFIPGFGRMKAIAGPQIASAIGLEKMRQCCMHFNDWLEQLERLSPLSAASQASLRMPRQEKGNGQ